jgi:hypothetical protein
VNFGPKRIIKLDCAAGHQEAFGAAVDKWMATEPLLLHVQFFGMGIEAELAPLRHGEGPQRGELVDDRDRARRVLRDCFPDELIATGIVEGEPWGAR